MIKKFKIIECVISIVAFTFLQLLAVGLLDVTIGDRGILQLVIYSIIASIVCVFIMPPAFGFAKGCVSTPKITKSQ